MKLQTSPATRVDILCGKPEDVEAVHFFVLHTGSTVVSGTPVPLNAKIDLRMGKTVRFSLLVPGTFTAEEIAQQLIRN